MSVAATDVGLAPLQRIPSSNNRLFRLTDQVTRKRSRLEPSGLIQLPQMRCERWHQGPVAMDFAVPTPYPRANASLRSSYCAVARNLRNQKSAPNWASWATLVSVTTEISPDGPLTYAPVQRHRAVCRFIEIPECRGYPDHARLRSREPAWRRLLPMITPPIGDHNVNRALDSQLSGLRLHGMAAAF